MSKLSNQILHVNNNGKPLDQKTIECLNKVVDIINKNALLSTWDEEYLPEPPPRITPKLEIK